MTISALLPGLLRPPERPPGLGCLLFLALPPHFPLTPGMRACCRLGSEPQGQFQQAHEKGAPLLLPPAGRGRSSVSCDQVRAVICSSWFCAACGSRLSGRQLPFPRAVEAMSAPSDALLSESNRPTFDLAPRPPNGPKNASGGAGGNRTRVQHAPTSTYRQRFGCHTTITLRADESPSVFTFLMRSLFKEPFPWWPARWLVTRRTRCAPES